MGILAATIANELRHLGDRLFAMQGGHPRPRHLMRPSDFLPQYDAVPQPVKMLNVRDMIALFRQQTVARGGTVVTPH
jgi:hypothetical protein